jgi:hypothetical protein
MRCGHELIIFSHLDAYIAIQIAILDQIKPPDGWRYPLGVHAVLGGVDFMTRCYVPQILRGKVKAHWQPIDDKLPFARFPAKIP